MVLLDKKETPTSTVRLKDEGCIVKNIGCRIESEQWSVYDYRWKIKGGGEEGGGVRNMLTKGHMQNFSTLGNPFWEKSKVDPTI